MPEAHATTQAAQRAGRLKAIGLMCLAVSLFSCLDASAKYLQTRLGMPTAQIVWVRFLGQLVLILLMVGVANVPTLVRTAKPWHQAARSIMLLGATAFNFAALVYLRLDQALTIQFLSPLIVALLAGPILGEWVGWRRFIAILVGFTGVVVAIRPGFADVHPAVLLSFGCMLSYVLFMLLTRYLAPYDPPSVTLFLSLFAGGLLYTPFAIMGWEWPQNELTWALLLLLGLLGGTGHYIFILAYRHGTASELAPFLYFQIVAATAIGYFVFGDLPDAWTLSGSAIVIASGLYLVHRERIVRARPSSMEPSA